MVDPASRHATASVAGVSSIRCPPIRYRGPGSGCPAVRPSGVRSPGGWSSRGPAVGRLLSSCPVSSCPVSIRAVSSRLVSALVGPDASVSSHAQAVAVGPGRAGRATLTTGTGGGPGGCRAVDGSIDGPRGGTRATLPTSRWSLGGRWRTRAAGLGAGRGGRACPLSDQAGQTGVRSAPRGWLRGGHGSRRQRQVAAPAAWLASSGWVGDHGEWSAPSLTAGWAAPEGPLEVPAGMGVRPQRGPSRRRARLARCRQRSDLRRWVVGLPGLEPGTSSLSGIEG